VLSRSRFLPSDSLYSRRQLPMPSSAVKFELHFLFARCTLYYCTALCIHNLSIMYNMFTVDHNLYLSLSSPYRPREAPIEVCIFKPSKIGLIPATISVPNPLTRTGAILFSGDDSDTCREIGRGSTHLALSVRRFAKMAPPRLLEVSGSC
jgi:hypothetical protein